MTDFNVDGFAGACKKAMAAAEDKQAALSALLRKTLEETDRAELIRALDAAIPPGADIGEMVFHNSPELTMLYGRIPPRFQSGIHNHTIFACIGQLVGEELNTFYERNPEGGLRQIKQAKIGPGEVLDLPPDAIHSIENPGKETGSALHLYGGDFAAIQDRRSVWTTGDHQEQAFSFEAILRESVRVMKNNDNKEGLAAMVQAIPATEAMVNALSD